MALEGQVVPAQAREVVLAVLAAQPERPQASHQCLVVEGSVCMCERETDVIVSGVVGASSAVFDVRVFSVCVANH